MKVKTAWLISFFILEASCLSGFAGSVEKSLPSLQAEPRIKSPRIISGTFISGSIGYASINWQNFDRTPFVSYTANPKGGLSYGFDAGYRFYSYFSLDGGFYKLPTVKGFGFGNVQAAPTLGRIGVVSWFGYVLGRFYLGSLIDYFYVTLGAGITYRQVEPKPEVGSSDASVFSVAEAYYYAPIFSAGLEYDIFQNWLLFFKYFYIPEYNRDIEVRSTKFFNTPDVNLFVFGIGYKFSI